MWTPTFLAAEKKMWTPTFLRHVDTHFPCRKNVARRWVSSIFQYFGGGCPVSSSVFDFTFWGKSRDWAQKTDKKEGDYCAMHAQFPNYLPTLPGTSGYNIIVVRHRLGSVRHRRRKRLISSFERRRGFRGSLEWMPAFDEREAWDIAQY
jgi:hypothetical protein